MFSPLQPFVYLLAYLGMLYIRPHEYVPMFQDKPILPTLLGLAFVFWLLRQPKNFEASQHRLLPVLMLLMAFSVALSGWVGGALLVLTDFTPIVLLFYMVSTTIDTLAKLRAVFVLLTAASCVMALHGIGQAADDLATGWTGAVMIEGRITYLGFLNDPNDLAMSMLMTLPMCLHMAHGRGFSLRWMFRAAALLILYGVYLTNSRGAILAVGSMLLIYCTRRYGLWRGLILVPLLAAPMVLLAPSRIGEISAEEDSAAGRVEAWYEGFQMLRSHPLFGVGKGQFTDHHTLTAHNSYVLALAELGIVGYFVWLSIIILTVMMLWALVRSGDPTPRNDASAVPDMPSTSWAVPAVPAMPMLQGERGTTEIDTWDDCQRSARTLFYGMVGILVSAYFLSRSYVVILYLQIALAVAVHQLARAHWPTFPRVLFGPMWGKLAMISVASAFFLWLVTRVLL